MPDLSKIKLNNTTYNLKDAALRERYGVCSTAKGTAAKTVSIPSVTALYEGLYIFVKFSATNTASSPTLQVNSLDAKPIMRYGTTTPSTSAASSWNAGSVVLLIYDGTYWQMEEWNNTTYSSMTDAEITAGTGTTARIITPARLKSAVETWAPVKSVNGDTGSIVVDKIKTTAGVDNTEYNLIGTSSTNTNNAAEEVYNPTLISFSKTSNNLARLTIGDTSNQGKIRLYGNPNNGSGYVDLLCNVEDADTMELELPLQSGTIALRSDIPDVKSWALAANKPSYTFSELTTTPTSLGGYGITDAYTKTEVDGMVSGVLHYKGTKATVSALPDSGNTTGDVWHITADGSEYAWDGTTWQELGTATDLSGYVPTSRTINGKALSSNISLTASDVSALPSSTTYVSSFNGESGAITYTAPVTSVNGQTGAVTLTIPDADDHKWNDVSLNKTEGDTSSDIYIPYLASTTSKEAKFVKALNSATTAYSLVRRNSSGYIVAATPSAGDNSTKVATTAFVNAAIPSVPSWALESTKPTYTASEVGALPDTTVIPDADDHKWNDVTLNKGSSYVNTGECYIPYLDSYNQTVAYTGKATATPTAKLFVKYDANAYLNSTTPPANDNSTKVATTAYVDAAIPSVPSWALASSKPTYTASEVGAVADTTKYVTDITVANHGEDLRVFYSDSTHNDVLDLISLEKITYTISISGNVITLTPSSGTAQTITLPVYNGGVE